MDDYAYRVLEAIEGGETEFKAAGDSVAELKDFRRELHVLKALQKSGHIEILDLREAEGSASGVRLYNCALVSLTDFGKRAAAALRERKARRGKG